MGIKFYFPFCMGSQRTFKDVGGGESRLYQERQEVALDL